MLVREVRALNMLRSFTSQAFHLAKPRSDLVLTRRGLGRHLVSNDSRYAWLMLNFCLFTIRHFPFAFFQFTNSIDILHSQAIRWGA